MQSRKAFIIIETMIMFLFVTVVPFLLYFYNPNLKQAPDEVKIDEQALNQIEGTKTEEQEPVTETNNESISSEEVVPSSFSDETIISSSNQIIDEEEAEEEKPIVLPSSSNQNEVSLIQEEKEIAEVIEEETPINEEVVEEEEEEETIEEEEIEVERPEEFEVLTQGGGGSFVDYSQVDANAGEDFDVYENDVVVLQGQASRSSVTYSWTCLLDEIPITLSNASQRIASFRAPFSNQNQEVFCKLKVVDIFNPAVFKEDEVKITVLNGPTIQMMSSQTVNEAQTVNLTAQAFGGGLIYFWQCDHKDVIIQKRNTLNASFSAPFVSQDEEITCKLSVRDLGGEIKEDEVKITILNGPIAISQGDITINENSNIYFDASSSIGAIKTYSWNCTDFPLAIPNGKQVSVSSPSIEVTTTYTCTLQVEDMLLETSSQSFNLTILKIPPSKPLVYFNPYSRLETEGTIITLNPIVISEAEVFDYSWNCTFNGNPVLLSNTSAKNPSLTIPSVNTSNQKVVCHFSAVNAGGSSSASQNIYIINGPFANAGPNQTKQENQLVTLNGSYQGNILSHEWSCDNEIELNNQSITNPSFTAPFVNEDKEITCTFTVYDFEDESHSSETTITILNGPKALVSNLSLRENTVSSIANSSIGDITEYLFSCENEDVFSFDSHVKRSPVIYASEVNENISTLCTLSITDSEGKHDQKDFYITITNYVPYTPPLENIVYTPQAQEESAPDENPGQQEPESGFTISVSSNGTITLVWQKGEGSTHTYIRRMQTEAPSSREEGELIYLNTGISTTDPELPLGETFCYSAWGYNMDIDQFSSSYSSACILVDLNIVSVEEQILSTTKYIRTNINTIGLLANLELKYKKHGAETWTTLPLREDLSSGIYTFEIQNLEQGGVLYDYVLTLSSGENVKTYTAQFVSEVVPPALSNLEIASNNANSINLSFDLNAGGALTNILIEYSENIDFTDSDTIEVLNKNTSTINQRIDNLNQDKTYFIQIVGENEKGESNTLDTSFQTETIIKDVTAENIKTKTLDLNFFLNTNAEEANVLVTYADNASFEDSETMVFENTPKGANEITIDNLLMNTDYFFKLEVEDTIYPNEIEVHTFRTMDINLNLSSLTMARSSSRDIVFNIMPEQTYTYLLTCDEGITTENADTANPTISSPYITENTTYSCTLEVSDSLNTKQESFDVHVNAGMVSYWSFNEGVGTTAYDSWSSNHGTLTNGPTYITDESECISGSCLSFDGVNDYVNAGNIGNISSWTISLWFNTEEVSNYRNILHTHSSTFSGSNVGVRIEQSQDYALGCLYSGVSADDTFRGHAIVPVSDSLETNHWYYLVIVGDAANNRVPAYLNGVLKTDEAHTSWPTSFPNLNIGRGYSTSSDRVFNGLIDEVKIYSEPLTENEIKQEYFTYRAINNITFENIKAKEVLMNFDLSRGADTLTNINIEYADNELFTDSQVVNLTNTSEGNISQSLTNLIPERTYYVKVKATNTQGESKLFNASFETASLGTNIQVSNIKTSTADIALDLLSNNANITLEYADNINFEDEQVITLEDRQEGNIVIPISELEENTTYFFKVTIEDNASNIFMHQDTFTTGTISLSISSFNTPSNEELTLSATITPTQDYTYQWNCDGGTLTNETSSTPTFISSAEDGTIYTCSLTISDGVNTRQAGFEVEIRSALSIFVPVGAEGYDANGNLVIARADSGTLTGESGQVVFLDDKDYGEVPMNIGEADVLIVGGGGAGGSGENNNQESGGGGGGAGGLIYIESYNLSSIAQVKVGHGGNIENGVGNDSQFIDLIAYGGGSGAHGTFGYSNPGYSGGSGGGGARSGNGGSSILGQGSNGGNGSGEFGGGGGGYLTVGGTPMAGQGGIFYGSAYAVGGLGGGVGLNSGKNALDNTGSGGGGGESNSGAIKLGGAGGSGIIIIRWGGYSHDVCAGTFLDTRDGQDYPLMQFGNQCWMTKNLNYETGSSWCYNNNTTYCDTYGRLYNWSTATTACPTGWHLPSDAEFTTLEGTIGSARTTWMNPASWAGLYGSYRDTDGSFRNLGTHGYWWASTTSGDKAWHRSLYTSNLSVYRNTNWPQFGFSVRCIRDSEPLVSQSNNYLASTISTLNVEDGLASLPIINNIAILVLILVLGVIAFIRI